MSEESWSILLEHQLPTSLESLDGETIMMLGLEEVLRDERIDVVFDPFRPGEGHAGVYGCAVPLRMLVQTVDLARAVHLLEEFREAAPIDMGGFEDEREDDIEPDPLPAPRPDTFEGW